MNSNLSERSVHDDGLSNQQVKKLQAAVSNIRCYLLYIELKALSKKITITNAQS